MAIKILSKKDTATTTTYNINQKTNILSQKVISATHYKQTGTIIIRNGQHSIKTKAKNNPIKAIKKALNKT